MKALYLVLAVVLLSSGCMLASKNNQPQLKVYTSSSLAATTSSSTTSIAYTTTSTTLCSMSNVSSNLTCPVCPECTKGLDLKTTKWLLNLRTSGQVPSYQAGYFDCKDDILEGLDVVNRSRFREAPSFSNSYTPKIKYNDSVACYLVNKTGWIVLNRTQADFKVIDNKLLLRPLKVQVLGQ